MKANDISRFGIIRLERKFFEYLIDSGHDTLFVTDINLAGYAILNEYALFLRVHDPLPLRDYSVSYEAGLVSSCRAPPRDFQLLFVFFFILLNRLCFKPRK